METTTTAFIAQYLDVLTRWEPGASLDGDSTALIVADSLRRAADDLVRETVSDLRKQRLDGVVEWAPYEILDGRYTASTGKLRPATAADRATGWTWNTIGKALGVSGQTAANRYKAKR